MDSIECKHKLAKIKTTAHGNYVCSKCGKFITKEQKRILELESALETLGKLYTRYLDYSTKLELALGEIHGWAESRKKELATNEFRFQEIKQVCEKNIDGLDEE